MGKRMDAMAIQKETFPVSHMKYTAGMDHCFKEGGRKEGGAVPV